MSQPAGADGLIDSGTALYRDAGLLAERLPDQDRAEIADRMRPRSAELGASASIRAAPGPGGVGDGDRGSDRR